MKFRDIHTPITKPTPPAPTPTLTQQQVAKLAKPLTQHAITKWRIEGNTLIIFNSIGQKFRLPLPLTDQPPQETPTNAGHNEL